MKVKLTYFVFSGISFVITAGGQNNKPSTLRTFYDLRESILFTVFHDAKNQTGK